MAAAAAIAGSTSAKLAMIASPMVFTIEPPDRSMTSRSMSKCSRTSA
jgi:hypothetical protein